MAQTMMSKTENGGHIQVGMQFLHTTEQLENTKQSRNIPYGWNVGTIVHFPLNQFPLTLLNVSIYVCVCVCVWSKEGRGGACCMGQSGKGEQHVGQLIQGFDMMFIMVKPLV